MAQIVREIEAGGFVWSLDLEDVHLNIEKRLTTIVGDAGKRLHTGRSRNDQVATDIRLYLRDAIDDIAILLDEFQTRLLDLATREAATPLPGLTHLQVAQPITFGHHLLAYFEMTRRDSRALRRLSATHQSPSPRRRSPRRYDLPDRPTDWSPISWVSTASVRTRWMPFPTATLRSNSAPPAHC
jgi:argininosuccinate lyase